MRTAIGWAATLAVAAAVVACGATQRTEASRLANVPAALAPQAELFAHRCSKCHALARALESGITDDTQWAHYVRRMRLQPGSGISLEDEAEILVFLRHLARTERERRATATALPAPGPATGDAAPAAAPATDGGSEATP